MAGLYSLLLISRKGRTDLFINLIQETNVSCTIIRAAARDKAYLKKAKAAPGADKRLSCCDALVFIENHSGRLFGENKEGPHHYHMKVLEAMRIGTTTLKKMARGAEM